jgi:hypothetical protein
MFSNFSILSIIKFSPELFGSECSLYIETLPLLIVSVKIAQITGSSTHPSDLSINCPKILKSDSLLKQTFFLLRSYAKYKTEKIGKK